MFLLKIRLHQKNRTYKMCESEIRPAQAQQVIVIRIQAGDKEGEFSRLSFTVDEENRIKIGRKFGQKILTKERNWREVFYDRIYLRKHIWRHLENDWQKNWKKIYHYHHYHYYYHYYCDHENIVAHVRIRLHWQWFWVGLHKSGYIHHKSVVNKPQWNLRILQTENGGTDGSTLWTD